MKPKRESKAIIMCNNYKYHLCTKFGIDADNMINYFKQAFPNMVFLIITREYHIKTQWDNRALNKAI